MSRRTSKQRSIFLGTGLALALTPSLVGCMGTGRGDFPLFRDEREIETYASYKVRVAWHRVVHRGHGAPYRPVESARAALDPARGRIYIGSTAGVLMAFDATGRPLFEYFAEQPIESAPLLDAARQVLYLCTGDGHLHAIRAGTGELLWKVNVGFPVDATPVMASDALYLATTDNGVVAVSRKDGAPLFSYKRPRGEDFTLRGRSGLTLFEDMIITGFDDGAVVALDASDGTVRWEYDTSADLEESRSKRPSFADVDATPVVIGREVYAASFSAGLYRLNVDSGSVLERDEKQKNITSLVVHDKTLLITSNAGLEARDTTQGRELWKRPRERGALSAPLVTEQGIVLYGESPGSFLAVDLYSGDELARIEGSQGFSAQASAAFELATVLGNGGTLYTLRLAD